jgi:hypothetical protein
MDETAKPIHLADGLCCAKTASLEAIWNWVDTSTGNVYANRRLLAEMAANTEAVDQKGFFSHKQGCNSR